MKSWNPPLIPRLAGTAPQPRAWDTASGELQELTATRDATTGELTATLYVCGITPYDATHLGHASTYLAFDTLIRLWRDAGVTVHYVQNVTDVDDPLLERATATGVDWRDLAAEQVELFRGDMVSLGIIPPDQYVGVTEHVDAVASSVIELLDAGLAYRLDGDIYFDVLAAEGEVWQLGTESGLDRATMLALSAERGGDPDRVGKRDALDPLLWRGERPGEPSWNTPLGAGRPGWHIECAVIAEQFLGAPITVQGGGSDLVFPHHEFTAGHIAALKNQPLAHAYLHTGMVAFEGEKMSKSLGNLVFVSGLTAAGTDPRAIRIALLAHHYREDWEWFASTLQLAEVRLERWTSWAASERTADDNGFVQTLRGLIADDLGTAQALTAIDTYLAAEQPSAAVVDAIDALLGIDIRA